MASIIKRTYKVTTADGRTVTKTCDHYTIQYRDAAGKIKRVKGYKDKGATKQLAARLERELARGGEGLVDEFKAPKARALAAHLAEYVADLRASGCDDMYVYNAEKRLKILFAGCGWTALADVEPNAFIRWRERERASDRRGHGRSGAGASATTLNQYLDTARAFLNWCAQNRRIEGARVRGRLVSTVLADVAKVEGPKVRKRRALTDEQVTALLAAAPAERRLPYRTALATGLRRQELADLVWGDLQLNAIKPYAQLRAEATKARRGDRLPIPQTLAADLREVRPADAKDSDRVFARVPALEEWKVDLAAAGIPYKDELGRQADFHAGTRKTLCTRMHRAGVPLATAMRVMRHTDAKLTMVDYADDEHLGMGTALPEVPVPPPAETHPDHGAAAAGAG